MARELVNLIGSLPAIKEVEILGRMKILELLKIMKILRNYKFAMFKK
jgi:hypothetical protein